LARSRKQESEAKSYDNLHNGPVDEDEEWERKQKAGDFDPDDDFM
jgi:hypothetical protein